MTDYGVLGGTRRFTGGFAVHYGELLSAAILRHIFGIRTSLKV